MLGRSALVTADERWRRYAAPRVSFLQLPIPWSLRTLVQRPLSLPEELLEILSHDGEPIVAGWARGLRGKVRGQEDLRLELDRLEAEGGPVARALAAHVRSAWRDFAGTPLPAPRPSPSQVALPLS